MRGEARPGFPIGCVGKRPRAFCSSEGAMQSIWRSDTAPPCTSWMRRRSCAHSWRSGDAFLRHYPKVEIGYSYKTNPLPGVLKICTGPARAPR